MFLNTSCVLSFMGLWDRNQKTAQRSYDLVRLFGFSKEGTNTLCL